jgi:hypothetical protein
MRVCVDSGQIAINPVLFECLSRAPHLKENKRVVVFGAGEQFVRETLWGNPRAFNDIKECPQKFLAMVAIESYLYNDNDFLSIHKSGFSTPLVYLIPWRSALKEFIL